MMWPNKHLLVLLSAMIAAVSTIELPLKLGEATCTAVMSSFDPILFDIHLPHLLNNPNSANFSLTITSIGSNEIVYEASFPPNTTFRRTIDLKQNIIHELCISYDDGKSTEEVIYIPYTQSEDFQSLINHIEIPQQLAKEQNLKRIYETAKKLEGVGKIIVSHQEKERMLEDEIVVRNIHKTQRIMTLSLVECLVIVLSGVYQICALRKFLIEKNLY